MSGCARARRAASAGTRRARCRARIASRSNSASIAKPASGRSPQIASVSDGCARHAISAHATISAAARPPQIGPTIRARPRPRAPREVRERQRSARAPAPARRAPIDRADRAALPRRSARTATPPRAARGDLDRDACVGVTSERVAARAPAPIERARDRGEPRARAAATDTTAPAPPADREHRLARTPSAAA